MVTIADAEAGVTEAEIAWHRAGGTAPGFAIVEKARAKLEQARAYERARVVVEAEEATKAAAAVKAAELAEIERLRAVQKEQMAAVAGLSRDIAEAAMALTRALGSARWREVLGPFDDSARRLTELERRHGFAGKTQMPFVSGVADTQILTGAMALWPGLCAAAGHSRPRAMFGFDALIPFLTSLQVPL